MNDQLSQNIVLILIVLLVALLIAWRVIARARGIAPPKHPALDGSEGDGLGDEHAAAVADIAGELLGVDVHAEIPGASGPADNLQTMKGVGAKLAAKLNENGVIRFDQIAALTPAQVEALDARMDPFRGRIARDRLVEQAGFLAREDKGGFEERFGKLGGGI